MSDLQMTLLHVVGGAHIGYGRMGVYLAKEMREQGVKVYDSILNSPHDRVTYSTNILENDGDRTPGVSNVICWASVPSHARGWWKGQVPMVFTMWEAMKLPESFRENMHEFDTVIVPSEQNLELFSQFHDNVKYVPLGIDPSRWYYRPRQEWGTRFNFLIGGSGPRKGTDLAVKAFQRAFPEGSWGDGPTPYLVMKQNKSEDFYGQRIERVTTRLSGADEANLYHSAHCYVQPSRGEGFGLQPLQAIAQGIPTILTAAHGHAAYAHLGMGLNWKPTTAGYFIYGDAGDWWEPDLDELIDSMRYVYYNYDEALARAALSSEVAHRDWTWKQSVDKFLDAVGREKMTGYEGPNEWYTPTAKWYMTATNCDTTLDIGGSLFIFKKGEPQPVPADVKRNLFEGGKLDPLADTITEGLLPDQVKRLPSHILRAQYCPTCYQKLGSGHTMADDIMAGRLDPETLEAPET